MANDLLDKIPISSLTGLNRGLSSAKLSTMIELLGRPREPLVHDACRNSQASPAVARLLKEIRMTPNFSLTGIVPAVESVQAILAKVKESRPDLIAKLSTEGMICVRHKNPTRPPPSTEPSNHSYGTAVDFKLLGGSAPGDTGTHVPRWVAILVPFFNEAGWFSGIDFNDAMHFEVADQTIRQWARDGKLGAQPSPNDAPVVADAGTGGSASSSSGRSTGSRIGNFFSGLFGHG